MGPAVGYTDLLDYEIQEKQKADAENPNRRRANPLRPSSAGYCARRLAYELAQYRGLVSYPHETRDASSWRLLELGHSVEFSALKNFQLLKIVEQRYKQQVLTFFEIDRLEGHEKEVIEGSCDIVFWSKNYKAVADVKSKKDGFSSSHKTKWDQDTERFTNLKSLKALSPTAFFAPDLIAFIDDLGDDWLTDNLYQLNLYACSEFMQSRGVDHAFIYQYNKNDSRHREIRFRPDPRAFERVRTKFNGVALAVDRKAIESVERSFTLGSSRCSFCPFKRECWKDLDATEAFFRTLPPKSWPKDLKQGDALLPYFEILEESWQYAERVKGIEAAIIKELTARGVRRIRLPNGHIYHLKFLKSPKEHFEIRRTKL